MVIIQLAGGLGNQMFQYALYLQLKSLGKVVKIDDVSGFVEDRQRVPVLAPFGVQYERSTKKELRSMLDASPFLHAKIRRRLCGRRKKSYFEEDKRYRPSILEWDDIYLEGYWQTEKYFQPISDQVRRAYDTDRLFGYLERQAADRLGAVDVEARPEERTKEKYRDGEPVKRTVREWLDRIEKTESVGVHIRRGDYLLPENQKLFGNICTEAYYRRAMERMRQEHPGCVFYFFTNDRQWAGQWAAGLAGQAVRDTERIEIVDPAEFPAGMDRDYAEFALLSRCRHIIMANSSFSWWASYLNRNPHKTVLAPDKWLNGWDCEDIYRADMQKISGKNSGQM